MNDHLSWKHSERVYIIFWVDFLNQGYSGGFMDPFYQNLPQVYKTIEDKFNGWREEFVTLNPDLKESIYRSFSTVIKFTGQERVIHGQNNQASRTTINIGNGYLLKFWADFCKGGIFAHSKGISVTSAHIEEDNEYLLRKYGFTRENGFWVPKHRVIGLSLEDNKVKVNPAGKGFTITEDASENGAYQVKDIVPEMFQQLQNGKEFEQSYQRHMFWLGWLYHHPEIHVSIRRHGTPENPRKAISRMLLARIKDNTGEIFIGDLDNLVFDKA